MHIRQCLPSGRFVIGVHMRLTPFPLFPAGDFLVDPKRVRAIIHEYLAENKLDAKSVALILSADTAVPEGLFAEFDVCTAPFDERTSFFLLSSCDVVIGTNTTYSNLAAWFADVPHIVATRNQIDWEYYRGREGFFENKYATFAFGIPGQE